MVYVLRIASAAQDGLSDRAIVDGVMVGWWSWHLFGWICRDVLQLRWLIKMGKQIGFNDMKQYVYPFRFIRKLTKIKIQVRVTVWLAWLAMHAGINYLLHELVYWWVVAHRALFLW